MNKNKTKMTIFLAVMLALVACGGKGGDGSSRKNKISRDPSHNVPQSSIIDIDTSKTNSRPSEQSQNPSSSSQTPVSNSNNPISSSVEPISSSSSEPSSPSVPIDEPFEYESYLVKHTEGQTVEYVFEAECTNLGGKEGPGYSGATSESGMAVYDMENGRGCVTYLYRKGCSINFFIVSDRNVDNAVMSLNLGGEFILVDLNPEKYQIRVDYPDAKYLQSAETSEEGCLGYWDALFLSTFENPTVNGGYFIDPWECESIEIDATGSSDIIGWEEFKITSSLKLKKGITCISLITANNEQVNMGTMGANAAVVDNMVIKTNAQLGMFDQKDNYQGTNGCHIRS